MKNILIVNGHPDKESFCFALAESYKMGAYKANSNVRLVHLIDLNSIFSGIKSSHDDQRKKWLEDVKKLGENQK